jgi:hypothetical protein
MLHHQEGWRGSSIKLCGSLLVQCLLLVNRCCFAHPKDEVRQANAIIRYTISYLSSLAEASTIQLSPKKPLFPSLITFFFSFDLSRISTIMVLDRLKQVAQHVAGTLPPPHPFDPLSATEIEEAVAIVRKEHASLFYNAVTLHEPRKAAMMAWLADPEHKHRPHRVADVVAIGRGSKVYDGLVDLTEKKILAWEYTEGVQPLVRFSYFISMILLTLQD